MCLGVTCFRLHIMASLCDVQPHKQHTVLQAVLRQWLVAGHNSCFCSCCVLCALTCAQLSPDSYHKAAFSVVGPGTAVFTSPDCGSMRWSINYNLYASKSGAETSANFACAPLGGNPVLLAPPVTTVKLTVSGLRNCPIEADYSVLNQAVSDVTRVPVRGTLRIASRCHTFVECSVHCAP